MGEKLFNIEAELTTVRLAQRIWILCPSVHDCVSTQVYKHHLCTHITAGERSAQKQSCAGSGIMLKATHSLLQQPLMQK